MKFIKKLQENLHDLNEEQKRQSFLLVWEGIPIQNTLTMKRIQRTLSNLHINTQPIKPQYDELYSLLKEVLENQEEKKLKELESKLNRFYSRPLNQEQKSYYPKIKNEIKTNLFPLNKQWLTNIQLDITACEEIEKKKLLHRFGLI